MLVCSFFGAVNALGITMLGEYVCRIYDQVRQRPLYLVERSVNTDGEAATTTRLEQTTTADVACDQLLKETDELLSLTEETVRVADESPAQL